MHGGPFTVEEVEDVKTVLRLLPIIFCTGGCNVGVYIGWEKLLIDSNLFDNCNDVLAYFNIFHLMMAVLHHHLIYPFFYNYIPTMLQRLGFGLLLLLSSFIISAFAGNVLLCSSQTNITCLVYHSEMFQYLF